MHDLATIQRMNAEAVDKHEMEELLEGEIIERVYGDWRDTIDLTATRHWFLFMPGDGTPFGELVDNYDGAMSVLREFYADPWDLIIVPGELEE